VSLSPLSRHLLGYSSDILLFYSRADKGEPMAAKEMSIFGAVSAAWNALPLSLAGVGCPVPVLLPLPAGL
jgi:hypothetical protein